MEKCHYFGFRYHPMPIYTLYAGPWTKKEEEEQGHKPFQIYVCHIAVVDGEIVQTMACREKAIADGYRYRRDLTPVR